MEKKKNEFRVIFFGFCGGEHEASPDLGSGGILPI